MVKPGIDNHRAPQGNGYMQNVKRGFKMPPLKFKPKYKAWIYTDL